VRHEATPIFRLPSVVRGAIANQQLRSGSALEITQDRQIQDFAALDYSGNNNSVITINPSGTGLDLTPAPALGLGTSVQTSEAITVGNICNVFTSGGAVRVQKANATDTTKPANAFVAATTILGAQAPVSFVGAIITDLVGLTPGTTYYLDTTGGAITAVPPSGAGNGVQEVGVALSSTTLLFHPKPMIGL
jgi:hypothetical protein